MSRDNLLWMDGWMDEERKQESKKDRSYKREKTKFAS